MGQWQVQLLSCGLVIVIGHASSHSVINSCSQISCDFQNQDMCGWTSDNDKFKWTIGKLNVSGRDESYFAHLKTSNLRYADGAVNLTSPWVQPQTEIQHYRLYFNSYLKNSQKCKLSVVLETDTTVSIQLWSTVDPNPLYPFLQTTTFNCSQKCRIKFQVQRSGSGMGQCGDEPFDEIDVDNIACFVPGKYTTAETAAMEANMGYIVAIVVLVFIIIIIIGLVFALVCRRQREKVSKSGDVKKRVGRPLPDIPTNAHDSGKDNRGASRDQSLICDVARGTGNEAAITIRQAAKPPPLPSTKPRATARKAPEGESQYNSLRDKPAPPSGAQQCEYSRTN